MSNTNTTVREVVLYKVKADHIEDYQQKVLPEIKTFLHNQKGFLQHECMLATKQEGYLIDVIAWESMEAAQASAAVWKQLTEAGQFANMVAAIEKVDFFDHLKVIS